MRFLLFLFLLAMTSFVSAQAAEISESDLRIPSAKDVLDQIEGKPMRAPEVETLDQDLSLNYNAEDTDPSTEQKAALEKYATQSFENRRIKILSYATEGENDDSSARRVSLERAIKVREFLHKKGISHRQIDMFPLGAQMSPPVRDQVIIQFTERP